LAWSWALQLSGRDALDLNDPSVMGCINLVANVAIDIEIRSEGSERTTASALCYWPNAGFS
jgi:hypothetical protein